MTAQKEARAPFSGKFEINFRFPTGTCTVRETDLDRDKLVMAAFCELLDAEDSERQRAIQSKASRETASRYHEVFTEFGRLGATVRDRNWLFGRWLDSIPAADREAGRKIVRRGRLERRAEFHLYFITRYLQSQPTHVDARGIATAVFHAERWYLAERVGFGEILVRSVADAWFLRWLIMPYVELGAILTAAATLRDTPTKRSDEHLRAALVSARECRPLDKPEIVKKLLLDGEDVPRETPTEANARLERVADLRWRGLQKLGAVTQRDLIRFDDHSR